MLLLANVELTNVVTVDGPAEVIYAVALAQPIADEPAALLSWLRSRMPTTVVLDDGIDGVEVTITHKHEGPVARAVSSSANSTISV